jgi:DDE superfamily endonuclease
MNVPTWALPVLTMCPPAFSTRKYHRFLVLVLAAVPTPGRQTVTDVLRTARKKALGPLSSSGQVFSQRRWAASALTRLLITYLLDDVVPSGPVLLAGDDTIAEHPDLLEGLPSKKAPIAAGHNLNQDNKLDCVSC